MTKKNTKGLGDWVEQIAKPIAKAIDKVAGTDIEHCEGCQKRKDKLNSISLPKAPLKSSKRNQNTRDGISITAKDWKFITELYKQPGERFTSIPQYEKAVEIANKYHPRLRFTVNNCATCRKKLMGYFSDLYENNI